MKTTILTTLIIIAATFAASAQQGQTIRGTVVDKDAKSSILGANVILLNSDPIKGAVTDIDGNFVIENVPFGRQSIRVSFIGYEDIVIPNINVVPGKQTILSIEMIESITTMEEIVIRADNDKVELNNDMTLVSARSFNLEETQRYAGSLNDPSRMAANFAGVASANDGRNDIVIRGNSPAGLLWRFEGLDIPNPNHYASAGATGGPVTILNNNQLAKSDFLTSAFPAEYGNAVSGAFDLKLRNGNNYDHEFLGQVSFNGAEFGAEGPLSKKKKGSYMFNYRYSTLALARAAGFDFGTGAAVPEYQDYSLKFNIPTKKGKFTIFSIGGASSIDLLGSESDLDSEDLFGDESQDIYNRANMFVAGTSYTQFFNKSTYGSIVFGVSRSQEKTDIDSVAFENSDVIEGVYRQQNIDNTEFRYSTHMLINKKFNARNTLVTGVMLDLYDFDYFQDYRIPNTDLYTTTRAFQGQSLLSRAYVQWKHKFSQKFSMSTGLYGQYFEFTNSTGIDPRISFQYKLDPTKTLTLGYGLHHQMQSIPILFNEELQADGTYVKTNQNLDFIRSNHFVLGYEQMVFSDFRVKAEAYYQIIDQAGVDSTPTSFSTLNIGADFGIPDKNNLVSQGEGENYGVELTLEKYFSRAYYFMVTTSLFDSKYAGSDNVWRNTGFNNSYIVNVLGGKEWSFGPRNNTFAIDLRATTAGGRYITPIDLDASRDAGYEIRDEENAFSQRLNTYFRLDLKISYRLNRPKVSHEFALDIQNLTNRQNDFNQSYNSRTGEINLQTQVGLFPAPLYRIYF